jgi:hypothetical protein
LRTTARRASTSSTTPTGTRSESARSPRRRPSRRSATFATAAQPLCRVVPSSSAKAWVPQEGQLLRVSRTTVSYRVRPARRSDTACVPHDGRILRASRTTVGYCVLPRCAASAW